MIQKLFDNCEKILVLEEGYPLIENQLFGILGNSRVKGRYDGTIPRFGELNPNIVAKAIGIETNITYTIPEVVAGRPPQLCDGCGHIDMYNAINEAISNYGNGRVFGDIGCYTMGALPPFNTLNSCVDMGASITMAKGASDAGLTPTIAVIGDSTFTHSGITSLLDCIVENTPIVVCISDNSFTAMTGGQKSHAENRLDLLVKGLGIPEEHFHVVVPLKKNHNEMVEVLKQEIEYKGISVIVFRRVCVTHFASQQRKKRAEKQD